MREISFRSYKSYPSLMCSLLLFYFGMCVNCMQAAPHLPTIPGPESTTLSRALHGTILILEGGNEVKVNSFPSGRSRVVKYNSDFGNISLLSGPDSSGKIAFITDKDSKFTLHVGRLRDRKDVILFTRKNAVEWDTPYGQYSFALSPINDRIAFISNLQHIQMSEPELLLTSGQIEVWDARAGRQLSFSNTGLDCGISWLPDGKHLVYVQLDSISSTSEHHDFGARFGKWSQIPIVYMVDITTGIKTKIGAGWYPVVSTDGKYIVVHDGDYKARMISVKNKKTQHLILPGLSRFVIAVDGQLIVYGGLRTTGSPFQAADGPWGPEDLETIKVARPNTRQFQTLLPNFDVRLPVSYGKSFR